MHARASAPKVRAWRAAGIVLAALACVTLVASGFLGVGRGAARSLADFDFYYAAGRCWLSGHSMYDAAAFTAEMRALGRHDVDLAFGYSPAFVPFALAFGVLPYDAARALMWCTSFAGIAFLCYAAARLVRELRGASEPDETWSAAGPWALVAIVAGSASTSTALWLGQLGPWMAALVCCGWLAVRRRELVLAGVFFGLTAIKPQFSFFPLVWLAFEREGRVLAVAALTALALCAYAMFALGPIEPFVEFFASVARYSNRADDANALTSVHVIGVPALLTAGGARGIGIGPFLAAVTAGVASAWFAREWVQSGAVLALLLAAHIALVYAHDIECLFLVPAWAWLWNLGPRRVVVLTVAAACLGLLSLPARFVGGPEAGLLAQWRSVVVLVVFALVCATARRARVAPSVS